MKWEFGVRKVEEFGIRNAEGGMGKRLKAESKV